MTKQRKRLLHVAAARSRDECVFCDIRHVRGNALIYRVALLMHLLTHAGLVTYKLPDLLVFHL